jgi:hypothetical protein
MLIFIINQHIPLFKSLLIWRLIHNKLTTIENIVNNLFLECDFATRFGPDGPQLLGFTSNTSSIIGVLDILKKSLVPSGLVNNIHSFPIEIRRAVEEKRDKTEDIKWPSNTVDHDAFVIVIFTISRIFLNNYMKCTSSLSNSQKPLIHIVLLHQ